VDAASPRLKVQVWIYRKDADARLEVLLLRLKLERGDYWQPVTGGVEADESLSQAALREAREESGLPFEAEPESLDYQFRYESPRRGGLFEEHVFALEAPRSAERIRLDPHEHVDSKWVSADAAASWLRHPSNAEGLLRLRHRKGAGV
jgi:8-oxo-dGTP pyrophosphatase MutT (NUDIX family)